MDRGGAKPASRQFLSDLIGSAFGPREHDDAIDIIAVDGLVQKLSLLLGIYEHHLLRDPLDAGRLGRHVDAQRVEQQLLRQLTDVGASVAEKNID